MGKFDNIYNIITFVPTLRAVRSENRKCYIMMNMVTIFILNYYFYVWVAYIHLYIGDIGNRFMRWQRSKYYKKLYFPFICTFRNFQHIWHILRLSFTFIEEHYTSVWSYCLIVSIVGIEEVLIFLMSIKIKILCYDMGHNRYLISIFCYV